MILSPWLRIAYTLFDSRVVWADPTPDGLTGNLRGLTGAICEDRRVLRANALNVGCDYDQGDPAGYRSARADLSERLGGQALAVKVYELPAGQSVCPYHYEYEEEWLLVLAGAVVVRTPEGEEELEGGDVVCFSPGPSGAHKASNSGQATARIVMFSSSREPAVAVYPDSDKIGVWPGNAEDTVMLKRGDGQLGYWDAEP